MGWLADELYAGFNQNTILCHGFEGQKYAIQSIMFFAYWTYFGSTTGQSIGKRLLRIKTADIAGNIADAKSKKSHHRLAE